MENKSCIIIAAGDIGFKFPYVYNAFSAGMKNPYIIAVDGGYDYCVKFKIRPDIVIGDFDSTASTPKNVRVWQLNPEKDESDTYAAVSHALNLGLKDIYIYGGIGGRLSHTLANIQTMKMIAESQARCYMIQDDTLVTVISNGYFEFSPNPDAYISVFAMDEQCFVTEVGVKYPLENHRLLNSYPLGLSNEPDPEYDNVSITVNGTALVIVDL
jgi:thiamine pyrophosphokinase